ncbi:uncharacterized protein LOC111999922 isoform X3 [Quercus suber]|uniref:L10-interacting myb domain-containing protein n=1 Tax=Quercus suber TaxID=58331 RepID=A0AAW0KN53_QUESU|nr:uncharacterized protein LOC111999921 [Quercus suber]XP_023887796.1 uncharacterized protein LOC111999921 [Quercus suber]
MELSSSSSDFAPSSSSSSNDVPAPRMAETSNAADWKLWPAPLVEHFIVILLAEAGKGNVRSGIIKRGHGQAITEEFNNRTGKHYSVEQIKGKLRRLRTKYNLFSQLIGMPGMGWDPNTNTVTGSDEAWLNATKSKSNYNGFRNKGLDHYGLLRQLFLTVAQTCSAQHSADDVDEQSSNPKGKQPAHTDASSRKKRKTVSFAPESKKTVDSAPVHDYSMAWATKILISMSGLDKETKFEALEQLRDFDWRQAFIAMDQDTRWEWIELLQTRD